MKTLRELAYAGKQVTPFTEALLQADEQMVAALRRQPSREELLARARHEHELARRKKLRETSAARREHAALLRQVCPECHTLHAGECW